MGGTILEAKKENSIQKNLEKIYKDLLYFQKETLAEFHPKLVTNNTFLDQSKWWYVATEGIHMYTIENDLFFANGTNRINYASFFEENVSFSRKPSHPIEVTSGEILKFFIDAELSVGIDAMLAVIEYSEKNKEKTTFISLEKEETIALGENTMFIRLALKVKGKGIVRIKKAMLERVFDRKSKPCAKNLIKEVEKFKNLKVACIFDEFTMTCYQKEVELISFTPENWKSILTTSKPHFLFVESAWNGNGGAWQYQVGNYVNVSRKPLYELIKWCNVNDIPTIFWNKEDPIHFDKFIDSAKYFDYIYTTDAHKIEDYKKYAKHEKVYALPFAAEPTKHNPIQLMEPRKNEICFAGSYYANRHTGRREIMEQILESSQRFGLTIYDRNFERTESEFRFPRKFENNVVGCLPYSQIEKAYKGYRFLLNVNSVINSPTMFSRRVFEGLASGTPILSSYSKGLEEMFGNLILTFRNPKHWNAQLKILSEDKVKYREKSLTGIREVYANHTYKHRLSFILENMGIEIKVPKKKVTVALSVTSEKEIEVAIETFKKQTYIDKKLALFIFNISDFIDFNSVINKYQKKDVSIYLLDYTINYPDLKTLLGTEYLTVWNGKNFYGRHYLEDLMIASIYTDADFIGKATYFEKVDNNISLPKEELEYVFVNQLLPSRSIVKTDYPFSNDVKSLLLTFFKDNNLAPYARLGAKMFSIDGFNFIDDGQEVLEKWYTQVDI